MGVVDELYEAMKYGERKLEYLTDEFFDIMRHDSSIASPYYEEREYAGNIAFDFIMDNPEFEIPPMKDGIYEFNEAMHNNFKEYCSRKCKEYGYERED